MTTEFKLPKVNRYPTAIDDEFDVFFEKMDETETDFVGVDGKGYWFYVDPFVDSVIDYEKRQELIGKNAFVKGYWSLQKKNGMSVFIIEENGLLII